MAEYIIGNACLVSADFSPAYTGLATVGYKIVNSDKTTNVDWTTTGVTELETGSGLYGVELASNLFSTTACKQIRFRTASGGVYATEDLIIKNPPLTAAVIAAAIWDYLTSAISTAGSIGKLLKDNLDAAISTRATPADVDVQVDADLAPLIVTLDAIKAQTDTIGSLRVTVTSPVAETGQVLIVSGDDYATSEGRDLTFESTNGGWPDLTDADEVNLEINESITVTGDVGSATSVSFELDAAETAALEGSYEYAVVADFGGRIVTLAHGLLIANTRATGAPTP